MSRATCVAVLLAMCAIAGCSSSQGIPRAALQLSEVSLQRRQLQTRRFETKDIPTVLAAAAHLLQDLGFNIDESDAELGIVIGSKDRTAKDTGQMVGSFFVSLFTFSDREYDVWQRLRASVVVAPWGKAPERT